MKLESPVCPNCGSKSVDEGLCCEHCGCQLKWSDSDRGSLRIVGMSGACPKCNFENATGHRFCAKCGTALTLRCPACGQDHPRGTVFCTVMGTRIEPAEPPRVLPELVLATEDGTQLAPPSLDDLSQTIRSLTQPENGFAILSLEDEIYLQLLLEEDGTFLIEYREGSADRHYQCSEVDIEDAVRIVQDYAVGNEAWKLSLPWAKLQF